MTYVVVETQGGQVPWPCLHRQGTTLLPGVHQPTPRERSLGHVVFEFRHNDLGLDTIERCIAG